MPDRPDPRDLLDTRARRGLLRCVRVEPNLKFRINDTARISHEWILDTRLQPRQPYAVVVDSLLTDVLGQKLGTTAVKPFVTTSYAPSVTYDHGKMLVERNGLRTLAVRIVNVDTLVITTIVVPRSAEASFLSNTWRWAEPFVELSGSRPSGASRARRNASNHSSPALQSSHRMPSATSPTATPPVLCSPCASGTRQKNSDESPIALLQVTDLAVYGRIGLDEGVVWVTGVRDGKP